MWAAHVVSNLAVACLFESFTNPTTSSCHQCICDFRKLHSWTDGDRRYHWSVHHPLAIPNNTRLGGDSARARAMRSSFCSAQRSVPDSERSFHSGIIALHIAACASCGTNSEVLPRLSITQKPIYRNPCPGLVQSQHHKLRGEHRC